MKAYTRFNNQVLFDKMQSLCPVEVIKGEGFNHWTDAATYLEWLIGQGDDVAMNIDIDCFITDCSVLEELVSDFKKGGYTHAGISDGGCLSGRNNISWAVMNPFFNLFAPIWILAKWNNEYIKPHWPSVRDFGFRPDFNNRKPSFIPEYEKSMWEPFNGIFNWLFEYGKPLWLHGDLHEDGISTIIKYKDKPFAIHTWYSREYGSVDGFHRERINARHDEALRNSTVQK
jgi:hypothetical protein